MKRKIKGLNREQFKRNLSRVLKDEYKKILAFTFDEWVADYEQQQRETGRAGWYELKPHETASGKAEEIRTN